MPARMIAVHVVLTGSVPHPQQEWGAPVRGRAARAAAPSVVDDGPARPAVPATAPMVSDSGPAPSSAAATARTRRRRRPPPPAGC